LDIRLELLRLHPEYFRDKKVLDIGCNSGFVTINFAKYLKPQSLLGIDIDGSLIETARKNLQKEKTDFSQPANDLAALNKIIFRKVRLKINPCILIFNLIETIFNPG
jgi:ribosomal protein L11 methylase PrmA